MGKIRDDFPTDVGTYQLRGVPKVFRSRASAVQFLRNSPGYVVKQYDYLRKNYKGLLLDAGISKTSQGLTRTKTNPWREGRGRLKSPYDRWSDADLREGSTLWGVPKPPGTAAVEPKSAPKPKKAPVNKPPKAPRAPAGSTAGAGDAGAGLDGAPVVDISGLLKLNPNTSKLLSTSLAGGGAKLFDLSQAGKLAGLQYDAQIQDLATEEVQAPRDTAQQKRDVGAWYGQVLDSLRTAAGRDTAAQKAGVQSVRDATAAIVGSLGGEANQGSALVGAAGADSVGTLSALGTAQDQYNADLDPLLKSERAGALSGVAAAGTARLHDLAVKLAQARGQRGQAEAANRLQLQEQNNNILDNRLKTRLGIVESNNAARQQNFGNAFGIEGSKISAAISGAEILSDALKSAGGSTPKGWGDLTPSAKDKTLQTVWSSVLGARGNPVAGKTETLKRAKQVVSQLGYDPSAVLPIIAQALQSQHPNWWRTSK